MDSQLSFLPKDIITLVMKYGERCTWVLEKNGTLWCFTKNKWIQIISESSNRSQRLLITDRINCYYDKSIKYFENTDWKHFLVLRKDSEICFLDNIYIIGKSVYKLVDNRWIPVAPMKTERKNPVIVVFNNLIFAIGGIIQKTKLYSVEYYDPKTNKWQYIASLRNHRNSDITKSVIFNNKIFLFNHSVEQTIEYYDKNIWFNLGLVGMCINNLKDYALIAYKDYIAVIGGKYNDGSYHNKIIIFCPFNEYKWYFPEDITPEFGECNAALW